MAYNEEQLTLIRDARAEALAAAERLHGRNVKAGRGAVSADDCDRSLMVVQECRVNLALAEMQLPEGVRGAAGPPAASPALLAQSATVVLSGPEVLVSFRCADAARARELADAVHAAFNATREGEGDQAP